MLDPTLLQSGWLLIAGGFLMNYLRNIPGHINSFFLKWCTHFIECPDNSASYIWVRNYLSTLEPIGGVRSASVEYVQSGQGRDGSWKMIPAPGQHYFWYRGRLLRANRYRKELESGGSNSNRSSLYENISVRFYFCGRAFVERFCDEARRSCLVQRSYVTVWLWGQSMYTGFSTAMRPLDSVVLPPGLKERVVADLDKFVASRDLYRGRGIPHRRGILFTGPPGNGKTSLIRALATHLKRDIAIIKLNVRGMDDAALQTAFSSDIVKEGIIALEDIDCLFEGRLGQESKVTFSGLLNAIDGIASQEGLILCMTTNHPEKLDPALIRPGRVDLQVEITNVVRPQAVAYFNKFYGEGHEALAEEFGRHFSDVPGGHSMAEVQNHLILHEDDPEGAVRNFGARIDA
jgi:chaperone BCS1